MNATVAPNSARRPFEVTAVEWRDAPRARRTLPTRGRPANAARPAASRERLRRRRVRGITTSSTRSARQVSRGRTLPRAPTPDFPLRPSSAEYPRAPVRVRRDRRTKSAQDLRRRLQRERLALQRDDRRLLRSRARCGPPDRGPAACRRRRGTPCPWRARSGRRGAASRKLVRVVFVTTGVAHASRRHDAQPGEHRRTDDSCIECVPARKSEKPNAIFGRVHARVRSEPSPADRRR